ncbi:MAG: hypothetical protein WAU30_06295 [Propionicimonas sp.]
MPNIFDDPEVKAAMAAAGVVHKPGVAQEVLRDLAPFLAEDGIDLNDLGDTDLDGLNAALARATARYNESIPEAGQPRREPPGRQPAGGSPFIRRPSSDQPTPAGVRGITSAPSHPGSASKRASKRGTHASGHPGRREQAQSDRALVREFDRWLRRQPEIAAPSPGEESGLFGELLKVAQHQGFTLRTPDGVEHLLDAFLDADAPEPDGAIAAAIATLHDYVHFRMDTDHNPEAWEEIHEQVEDALDDALPGSEILEAAIVDTEQLAPDERRAALAATELVAHLNELLDWIGTGRKVSPSGGLRRADIAFAASLLGIAAVGVAKLPPFAPDSPALIDIEPDSSPPNAIRARAMKDVPLLPSWWTALASADLIQVNSYRVAPGPSSAEWTAESVPPLDLAETVVGLTVSQFICEDLENRSARFAERVTAIMIGHLLRALAPGQVEPPLYENEFDRLLESGAMRNLQRLERVGVLVPDAEVGFVVPHALRGAVARGVLTALAVLGGAFETD